MAAAFLSLFAGIVIMGWVGSFYQQMSNGAFWTLDAAIAFVGGALILLIRRPLASIVEPGGGRAQSPGR